MIRLGWRFMAVVFCLLMVQSLGRASVLLVQNGDVWLGMEGIVQPYEAMEELGIPYERVDFDSFLSYDWSAYDVLFLEGSANNTDPFLETVPSALESLEEYVDQGGLLVIHFADWSTEVDVLQDIAPLGVGRKSYPDQLGRIAEGMEDDPLLDGITFQYLQDWYFTSHGYLIDLPNNAQPLILNKLYEPIYVRYAIGEGEVWVTTMPMEWGNKLWNTGKHRLFWNEMQLIKDRVAVVPEPSSFSLILVGLSLLAGLRRKESR